MGSNSKLIKKILRKETPSDITIDELDRLLIYLGFVLQTQNSSHRNYKHQGLTYLLTIATHGNKSQVLKIYIKNTKKAFQELGINGESTR